MDTGDGLLGAGFPGAGLDTPTAGTPLEAGATAPLADSGPHGRDDPRSGGRAERRSRRRKKRRSVYAHDSLRPPPVAPPTAVPVAAPEAPLVREPAPGPTARSAGRGDEGPFYAALDLGTNNCRLLIAAPRERGFRVVDAFSRIVRLGEGIAATGRLSEAAMDRAVAALRVCSQKLTQREVRRARLIATEACRMAFNGGDFVARVSDETGLRLEIVSRETEARLAVSGCASLVDPNATGALLFDIGGGSSELVWIDLRRPPGAPRRRMAERVRSWMSLPVGVVNLSERYGGRQVTEAVFEAMVAEVAGLLAAFPEGEALDAAVAGGAVHLLGTSGTVTTLAGVHLGLDRYDRRRIDGVWMSAEQVSTVMEALTATDYAGRVANPCIGRERADLVLAGCAILEAMRRRWPCQRLRVADRGLREGMLVELMAADGVWRVGDRRRPGSIAPSRAGQAGAPAHG